MPTKRIGFVSYLTAVSIGFVGWIFFRVLNRTKVEGRQNILHKANHILTTNHIALIDSLLVAVIYAFPRVIIKPGMIPFHMPDAKNFFDAELLRKRFGNTFVKLVNPITSFLLIHLKCIPVIRGARDYEPLKAAARVLPKGVIHIFPEGTRSRTGKLGKGKIGIGYLVTRTRPTIQPILIEGMEKIMPIGRVLPKIGQKITIHIGAPFSCDQPKDPDSREGWQTITDQVMGKIAALASETN